MSQQQNTVAGSIYFKPPRTIDTMTKTSYILLIGIAIMIVIGAAVFNSTGGNSNSLPTSNQIATPIATVSSSISSTGTVISSASSTSSTLPAQGTY